LSKKLKRKDMIIKIIWARIRYYQMISDMPDAVLAEYLGVTPRTLLNYDKDASNLGLGQIAQYVYLTGRDMSDLFPAKDEDAVDQK